MTCSVFSVWCWQRGQVGSVAWFILCLYWFSEGWLPERRRARVTLVCLGSDCSSGLMSGGGLCKIELFGLLRRACLVVWVCMCLFNVVLFGMGGRFWKCCV